MRGIREWEKAARIVLGAVGMFTVGYVAGAYAGIHGEGRAAEGFQFLVIMLFSSVILWFAFLVVATYRQVR